MSNYNARTYLIDSVSFNNSGSDLGKFIVGYTDERVKFKKSFLLMLLIPLIGLFVVLYFLAIHYLKSRKRIYFFENGILVQDVRRKSESVFRYDEIKGISVSRTRQYMYGIYQGTFYHVRFLYSNMESCIFMQGSYRNEQEVIEKFNFDNYVIDTLINQWTPKAISKFNAEMRDQGYGVFYTDKDEVHLGKDFLRVGDNYISPHSKFNLYFFNGSLNISIPNTERGSLFQRKTKNFSINVNEMYNKEVFLSAIERYFGINSSK